MNLASAIRAPVLPAETMALARPDLTASIARPMLVPRPWRRTCEGRASASTRSGVCSISQRAASSGRVWSRPPQSWLIAVQQKTQVGEALARHVRARDHHLRRVIAAHGIEGDGRDYGHGPLSRWRCPRPAGSPHGHCSSRTPDRRDAEA